MRNNIKTKIDSILTTVEKLPYFNLNNLLLLENNKNYLKILLSRKEKSGRIIRLKKGIYVTERYMLEHLNRIDMSIYYEFLVNLLYSPAYLSLDYVLNENNLLTEISNNFTAVTKNKTMHFSNRFGNFIYHKVKDQLFCGFNIIRKNGFIIYKATKAKALFDWLYLRKNQINDILGFEELRLNIDNLTKTDIKELKKYIDIEGSKKMKEIFEYLK